MIEEKSDSAYKFKILKDSLSTVDLFDDKTHERASHSLYNLMSCSDEGITIGLEGSWGAGKSTVLHLLKQQLDNDNTKKTLFFLFDAWSHEGDPLRRIFLESFIKTIDPHGSDSALSAIAGDVSGRQKQVEIKTRREVSKLGKLLPFFALFIPLGSSLLSRVSYDELVFPWSRFAGSANMLFILGVLFACAPLILLLFWALFGEKRNGKVTWDIFTNESVDSYVQNIVEDGERTTIEFENLFIRIIRYLSEERTFDRIIIVIDNLDRVKKEHAQNIWATLQTFFQLRWTQSGSNDTDFLKKLWFIIPFDRTLFLSGRSDSAEPRELDTVRSLREKTFQAIVEVPKPLMSGWMRYCKACVHEALLQWPEAEKAAVITCYQRFNSRLDVSPTPRSIRLFVNQVGVNGLRWGGSMSPDAIALYSLLRIDHSENELRDLLVSNQVPYDFGYFANASDVLSELAGMLFGVDKNRGYQLLIGPSIEQALMDGDGKTLSQLKEAHGDAFWIVWQSVQKSSRLSISHSDEYKIAYTQAIYDGLRDSLDRIKPQIINLIAVWRESNTNWRLQQLNYATCLKNLSELCENKNSFTQWLATIVKKITQETVSSLKDRELNVDELRQLRNIYDLLINNGANIKPERYEILDLSNWQKWIDTLASGNLRFPEILPAQNTMDGIYKQVVSNASGANRASIQLLCKTIKLVPTAIANEVIYKVVSDWLMLPKNVQNLESFYELVFVMLSCGAIAHRQILLDAVKQDQFWRVAYQKTYSPTSYINFIAAQVFRQDLQAQSIVQQEIRKFWADEKSTSEMQALRAILLDCNQLFLLEELAKDSTNTVAKQALLISESAQ